MKRAFIAFGMVFCLAASTMAEPTPQVLDQFIQQLRKIQHAIREEAADEPWQERIANLTDPLLELTTEIYRSTLQEGAASSAYGLRVRINSLRAARDAGQANEVIEELIETASFLRNEHLLVAQKPPLTGSVASRTRTREILGEILRRPEFAQQTKPSVFDYYVNRIIVKVIEWLRGLFDSQAMRQAGRFAFLLLWFVYAIVAALIVWFIYRAWSPSSKRKRAEADDGPPGGPLLPEGHLAEVEAFIKQGNFAAAIRAYFLVLLATLEQRDLVARNRTWTNWEYLRAFGKRIGDDRLRARMAALASVCDQVSYRGETCDESRFLSFRTDVEGFLETLQTVAS